MTIFQLSLKNISKKLFFSLFSFVIAGSALVFSLFYIASIEHSVSKSLALSKGEYISYVNEERFSNIPVNYYERFKEEFDYVIPYVYNTGIVSYDYDCMIIGTDIKKNIIYYNGNLYNYEIELSEVYDTEKPLVYLSENLKNSVNNNLIEINGIEYQVGGFIKILEKSLNENIVITTLDIYGQYVDMSIINNDSGIYKYIIDTYYITSNQNEDEVINTISMIYNAPDSRYFVDSYKKIFDSQMEVFMMFSNIPVTFFILVSVFSFFNIYISINLSIAERKKYYSILSTLGMKLKHLRKMIIIEMSIISVISAILSIFIGMFISLIAISASKGLTFAMASIPKFFLTLIAIIMVPIILTTISTRFIKYKQII